MDVADDSRDVLRLSREAADEIAAHARSTLPAECCGLIGGAGGMGSAVYRLRNVAPDTLTAYEAAPEELFDAQREMRARGETLVAIYHSHPRAADPVPSTADVRLAFYPAAIYIIIGFDDEGSTVLRAFRIPERDQRWERVALIVEQG